MINPQALLYPQFLVKGTAQTCLTKKIGFEA